MAPIQNLSFQCYVRDVLHKSTLVLLVSVYLEFENVIIYSAIFLELKLWLLNNRNYTLPCTYTHYVSLYKNQHGNGEHAPRHD